ncbi:DUF397 domain-containing protein [Streptomyces sp. NPDC052015]|uniref:DUF397 domain-containing protein n=1 Tax=Streptomyces sp. NPDC052015 TaxID=3154755 RepID=UPI0034269880
MSVGPQSASEPVWFKSSYSGGNATECVEAALVAEGLVVRDSKILEGPHVTVSSEAWSRFVSGLVQ